MRTFIGHLKLISYTAIPLRAKAKIGWEYKLPFENLIKQLVEEELKHGSEVNLGRLMRIAFEIAGGDDTWQAGVFPT